MHEMLQAHPLISLQYEENALSDLDIDRLDHMARSHKHHFNASNCKLALIMG